MPLVQAQQKCESLNSYNGYTTSEDGGHTTTTNSAFNPLQAHETCETQFITRQQNI